MAKEEAEQRELVIDPETLGECMEEIEEAISDKISDMTGFCHSGFTYAINVTATLDTLE